MNIKDFSTPEGYTEFVKNLVSPHSMVDFNSKLSTAALGLSGECGEIAQLLTTVNLINLSEETLNQDPVEKIDPETGESYICFYRLEQSSIDDIILELGDIIWYVTFASIFVVETPLEYFIPEKYHPGEMTLWQKKTSFNAAHTQLSINCGSFADLVKKILFHGKPCTSVEIEKLKDNLIVIMKMVEFIGIDFCGVFIDEIIKRNVVKLSGRYKSLEFNTKEFLEKENAKNQ